MTDLNCEYVRDVYPDVLNGKLDASLAQRVRAHVAACDECRGEAALLEALHAHPTQVPAGLHERVVRNATRVRPVWRWSRADLAMVATLAAALIGGSVIMQGRRIGAGERTVPAEAAIGYVGVEGTMLSGKASLDDLSVEELETLLGEMES
jgi:predicted anti-sigma-YlaC factor YlaD